jgi:hypothetical protein
VTATWLRRTEQNREAKSAVTVRETGAELVRSCSRRPGGPSFCAVPLKSRVGRNTPDRSSAARAKKKIKMKKIR